jgi:hypothetical protein
MAMVCVLLMAGTFEASKSMDSSQSLGKNRLNLLRCKGLYLQGNQERLATNLVNLARKFVNRLVGERDGNA